MKEEMKNVEMNDVEMDDVTGGNTLTAINTPLPNVTGATDLKWFGSDVPLYPRFTK